MAAIVVPGHAAATPQGATPATADSTVQHFLTVGIRVHGVAADLAGGGTLLLYEGAGAPRPSATVAHLVVYDVAATVRELRARGVAFDDYDLPELKTVDGTPAAEHAIREGGPLLASRDAVVLVVWKQGLAFELVALPASSIGLPPAQIDVATVLESEREMYRAAESQARRGAALARRRGSTPSPASSPTTPETPIHETILRVAGERDAAAILIGSHGHGPIGARLLGGITRGVPRQAEVPVVVVRHAAFDRD